MIDQNIGKAKRVNKLIAETFEMNDISPEDGIMGLVLMTAALSALALDYESYCAMLDDCKKDFKGLFDKDLLERARRKFGKDD